MNGNKPKRNMTTTDVFLYFPAIIIFVGTCIGLLFSIIAVTNQWFNGLFGVN